MDLSPVNVSMRGLFQNGEPFDGKLRVKLSSCAVCENTKTLVMPKAWEEFTFSADGDLTVNLIPNDLIGEDTYYLFEVVKAGSSPYLPFDKYVKKQAVASGVIVVPTHDCDITEIATLVPQQQAVEAAQAYASEAKQARGDILDDAGKTVAAALAPMQAAALEAVKAEGKTQVALTLDAGTAQVSAVKAEGDTQAARSKSEADQARAAATKAGEYLTEVARYRNEATDTIGTVRALKVSAENARDNAQEALQSADQHARNAAASEQAALTAKDAAETAQGKAQASETAAKASENAAKKAETVASLAAQTAKSSEQAAASSEIAAAESASAAKASETAAATSATAAATSATAAEAAKAGADAAKTAAASSAKAAANSAAAAKQSATEAASQVTDTLKRINFCNGKFYSQYYNASSRSITWNENINDACLMAWNDRYIIITTSPYVGWIVVNGSDFSFISSSPYHHSLYLYTHAKFNNLGFNGSRVAIFYRFDEYTEGGTECNYAEVLDANTGEVLIEKTYTAEEMAFIKAAPCFCMGFTCILKNGDMIHRGVVFSGEDLSIKGYVAAEEGFAVVRDAYSTYCCYLTANADNSYSGEYPIIVQSNDFYSFWVDDRYTLGEDGEPIVTLRNFHVDGIFSETNSLTRCVGVLFSKNTKVYAWYIYNRAIVRNQSNNKVSIYNVALDETQENRIVFTKSGDIDYTTRLQDFIPVNFYDSSLNYADVPFYYIAGALIYSVGATGAIAKYPCIALQAYDNNVRWNSVYYLPSVAYTNAYGAHSRPLPVSRYFFNNSSLIYPVENI